MYVYFHINPSNNCIFYVGIGHDNRAWDFKNGRNSHYKNVILKYGNPIVKIYKENLSKQEACSIEKQLIAEYGRIGYEPNGILVNKSTGGESGVKGVIRGSMDPQTKEKIKQSTIGKTKHTFESKEKIKQHMNGKKYSQESKDKMSQSSKGKIKNWDERNKKASEKLKGRKIEWNLKGIPKKPHTRSTNIPVAQYDLQGNFIKEYTTIMEASNGNKSLHEGIRMCLKGKYKTAGGFIWKVVETKGL